MTISALEFRVEHDDFEDICDTAGYSIGYWARQGQLRLTSYIVTDEDGVQHKITPELLGRVMVEVAAGRYDLRDDIIKSVKSAVEDQEYGDIDTEVADVLIQIACFGVVIYA
jgi:hypothetical protein